jgi:protein FAM50
VPTPQDSNSASASPRSGTPAPSGEIQRKRLCVNASVAVAPKALTKSALLREAQTREGLRKEFLALQEAVKATEITIPFVFYDGTNIPGGVCKVKKGDYVWVFLDRSRKVGAELGVGEKANSRREWARVGVDDLMLVRGTLIIPHVLPPSSIPALVLMKHSIMISITSSSTELWARASVSFSTTARSHQNRLNWLHLPNL